MKAFVLVLFCSIYVQAQTIQTSETRFWDLKHTQLKLEPHFENHTLSGEAILHLSPVAYPLKKLVLDAKGMEIQQVQENGTAISSYEYDGQELEIDLEEVVKPGQEIIVGVKYLARPDAYSQKSGSAFKGLYFIDGTSPQVWTEGETEYNSVWFPTLDQPNEMHQQEISIKVDTAFSSLSNGLLVQSVLEGAKRTDTWKQDQEQAVYLSMIAVGKFKKVVDPREERFEVSYYVEPEYEKDALEIFGATPKMISFFENYTGVAYPWKKYSQIAVKEYISGAMENNTATVHGADIQKHKPSLIDQHSEGIIAHELFHHWFGNLVTCESWGQLTLNEAFAEFSEQLWMEYAHGEDEGTWAGMIDLQNYLAEAEEKKEPLIRYAFEDKEDMFDSHTYEKGARVLNLLRYHLGEAIFKKGLKEYLETHRHQTVEIHQLRIAFEKVSGKDLRLFFEQWFLQPGHPDLYVEHSLSGKTLEVYVEQTAKGSWQFPLEILVVTDQEEKIHTLFMEEEEEEFEIPLAGNLQFVMADPRLLLPAEIEHPKTDSMLLEQFTRSSYVYPRYQALALLTSQAEDPEGLKPKRVYDPLVRNLALMALEDPFWRIREMSVQQFFDYDGEDFLAVEKALQGLIRTDGRAQVRAGAILAMRNFLNPQNDLLFRESLKDSSALVQAAALESILINQPEDGEELIKPFMQSTDVGIFGSVASYLARTGEPVYFNWFIEKMNMLSGRELYQVLGAFSAYLVQSAEEIKLRAVPFLEEKAVQSGLWFTRFQAGQGLLLLSDLPSAQEAFQRVKTQEKNQQVLDLYAQFGG